MVRTRVPIVTLRPRIYLYSIKKGVIDACFKRLKEISPAISTTRIPIRRRKETLRRNYHGEGKSTYDKYHDYKGKGYVVVKNISVISKVLETVGNFELLSQARIT